MSNAKGTTLLSAVRFLRHHRERSLELLKPEHQHYLDDRIQESKWYPEADLLALIEAILPQVPGTRDSALAEMGAQSAREHFSGVYAHLAGGREATPSASQAFAIWASQHDTGEMKVEREGPGVALMSVRDFGNPTEVLCGVFAGYFTEVIRLQGGLDVRAEKLECVLRGDARCAWKVTSTS